VICLNVAALGYSVPYDSSSITDETRTKGMVHEMGHSLHLAHDDDGAMSTCWCYSITTGTGGEAPMVNSTYSSAP